MEPRVDEAADAASAVSLVRHAARTVLASAAGTSSDESHLRLASALHTVQSACCAIDISEAQDKPAAISDDPILQTMSRELYIRCHAARDRESGAVPMRKQETPQELASIVRHFVPLWLLERQQRPLTLHTRECRDAGYATVELRLEGAFCAVVNVVPTNACWAPTQMSIGPAHDPMLFGARQPPSLLVFHDICARGGTLVASLGGLALQKRLPAVIDWLCSLHNLFESSCAGCGAVLPPHATSVADLLPPTARGASLLPYHPACYFQLFGCSPEHHYVEHVQRSQQNSRWPAVILP